MIGVNAGLSEKDGEIILNAIGKQALSNCYLPYNEIIKKIANMEIHLLSHEDIVLLIQDVHGIHKMYYFVKENKENEIGVDIYHDLSRQMGNYSSLMTDFISSVPCNKFDIIENLGYQPYKKYLRYHILEEKVRLLEPLEKAMFAGFSEIDDIYQFLYCTFDVLTDHLPSKEELYAFVKSQQIIKICRDNKIAGVLLFEKQGAKSYLRAICVNPEYRNREIGYSLMVNYIKITRNDSKSFYLWVESENKDAIRLYEKLGYEPDGLIDYIFLYGAAVVDNYSPNAV